MPHFNSVGKDTSLRIASRGNQQERRKRYVPKHDQVRAMRERLLNIAADDSRFAPPSRDVARETSVDIPSVWFVAVVKNNRAHGSIMVFRPAPRGQTKRAAKHLDAAFASEDFGKDEKDSLSLRLHVFFASLRFFAFFARDTNRFAQAARFRKAD